MPPWARVAPGTLFTGVARQTAHPGPQLVVLEVVTAMASPGPMTVALHNDGGWDEARTLIGSWALDASGEGCRVTLRTGPEHRIADGGPLLDEDGTHTLIFDLTADGQLVPVALPWGIQLSTVSDDEAARQKRDLQRAMNECFAALRPGREYQGLAVSKLQPTTESVVLRITGRDPTGLRVEAVLEAPTHPGWTRRFTGSVEPNRHRAGQYPIRLTSPDTERIREAGQTSLLGYNSSLNGLTLVLRPAGDRLVGQANYFRCEFVPAAEP